MGKKLILSKVYIFPLIEGGGPPPPYPFLSLSSLNLRPVQPFSMQNPLRQITF